MNHINESFENQEIYTYNTLVDWIKTNLALSIMLSTLTHTLRGDDRIKKTFYVSMEAERGNCSE